MLETNMPFSSEYDAPSIVFSRLERFAEDSGRKLDTLKSAFYRRVRSGEIRSIPPVRKNRERVQGYFREDVNRFLSGELVNGRKRKRPSQASVKANSEYAVDAKLVDGHDDVGEVYKVESGILGWGQAIYPHIIESWQSRNGEIYWLLRNPKNDLDVWAVIGILPLEEDVILQLLNGKLLPKDIRPQQILIYEPGHVYSGYITTAAVVPEHRDSLVPLMEYILTYWCESSDIYIDRLFASSGSSLDENPILQLIAEYDFKMIYEFSRSNSRFGWVLPSAMYNRSSVVQNFQECQARKKENNPMLMTMPNVVDERSSTNLTRVRHTDSEGYFTPSSRFRLADSDEDIREIVRINRSLFGAGSVLTEDDVVSLLRSWWQINKEVFQVLEVDGRVVGYISLLPLPMTVIKGIMSDDIRVSQIRPSDIQPFESDHPTDLYVWTVGLHPDAYSSLQQKRTMGRYLLQGITQLFHEFSSRGVEIRTVWARSDTEDGIGISLGLGFERVEPTPSKSGKPVFVLDLVWSTKPYAVAYMEALEAYRLEHSVWE